MGDLSFSAYYDLTTPDGSITSIHHQNEGAAEVTVTILQIPLSFLGFSIDKDLLFFNLKSTLGQIGLNSQTKAIHLHPKTRSAEVKLHLTAYGALAKAMLPLLIPGCFIGKLFARDDRRRVRDPDYLLRMLGRCDEQGDPLLSFGGEKQQELIFEKLEGRTVAFLPLLDGIADYDEGMLGFLPTLAKLLMRPQLPARSLLLLHQIWKEGVARSVTEHDILLVRTAPLHVRTVFGLVVDELLPQGFHHTSASLLQPDTQASGDIYELYGTSSYEISAVPLEFYTLEPHREHVFFSDRDQLQAALEDPGTLFRAFHTAPNPPDLRASIFIVKSDQLLQLKTSDWIAREVHSQELPGLIHPGRQALMVDRYIKQHPSYLFLKAIEEGHITSEGILLTRFFPSPLLKPLFLTPRVQRTLKAMYFWKPSCTHGEFFSHEDRSFLLDLAKFAIPTYWVDETTQKVLQYVPRPEKDTGMFVPLHSVETFLKSTFFGIYGSNLLEFHFERELSNLLMGVEKLRSHLSHPLLNARTPLALVTGGGPGVMEMGNRIARKLGILSCANIVDFKVGFEKKHNAYIDAKMTYRLDRLVERQGEFNLDFPFFAVHLENWQQHKWDLDSFFKLGYELSKLQGVGRKVRFYAGYHQGFSYEGQFFNRRTKYGMLGMSWGF